VRAPIYLDALHSVWPSASTLGGDCGIDQRGGRHTPFEIAGRRRIRWATAQDSSGAPRSSHAYGRPSPGAYDSARADEQIESYPEEMRLKGILRRIVQIAKRHRDLYFIDDDQGLAPLSIIITTLASRAYEFCATRFVYDH
jgi:hypothetical protein